LQLVGRAQAQVIEDLGKRLADLEDALGDRTWIDGGEFTVGDLMMVSVLGGLRGTGVLDDYPASSAYVERGEARPAHVKAMADHLASFAPADAAKAYRNRKKTWPRHRRPHPAPSLHPHRAVLSGLVILFLAMGCRGKLIVPQMMIANSPPLGLPADPAFYRLLGAILAISTLLYAVRAPPFSARS
jgi:hypothetical protein